MTKSRIEQVLEDAGRQLAWLLEVDARDPDTDAVTRHRYATANARGGGEYRRYLLDPGDLSVAVEVDELASLAPLTVSPARLANVPVEVGAEGPLAFLADRSLSGRRMALHMGDERYPVPGSYPWHWLSFDGVDDYAEVTGAGWSQLYDPAGPSLSIELLVEDQGPGMDDCLWSEGDSGSINPFVALSTAGGSSVDLVWRHRDDSGTSTTSVTFSDVFNGGLKHIVLVDDNGSVRCYVNGKEHASGLQTYTPAGASNLTLDRAGIGALLRTGQSNFFPAHVHYLRAWSRVLPPDEVRQLYETATPASRADLALEWRIDEESGTALADASENGAGGTITGAAWDTADQVDGLPWTLLNSGTVDGEPVLEDDAVELRWQSALQRLEQDLEVPSYVGEPGALRVLTATGVAVAADVAEHHLTEFTVAGRFYHPGVSNAFPELSQRRTGNTAENWWVAIGGSGSPSPGQIWARASSGGSFGALSLLSADRVDDGAVHTYVFARRDAHAYLMVDGEVVAEDESPAVPDTPTSGVTMGRRLHQGPGWLQDTRLYNGYLSPDEARSAMAVRASGDEEGLVGLWRGDDYTGGTLTDYSDTGAHATLSGVEGTDYEWVSSTLGGEQLAGRSMPHLAGAVFNAPADLVDAVLEVWRFTAHDLIGDNLSAAGPTVRDEGEELTGGGVDYTWGPGESVVYLTGEAGEPVTVERRSVDGLSEVLVDEVLVALGALSSAEEIDAARLNVLLRNDIGFALRRRPAAEVLREFLEATLGYAYMDAGGVLRLDSIIPPSSPSPRGGDCVELVGDSLNQRVRWDPNTPAMSGNDFTIALWFKAHRWGPVDTGSLFFGSSEASPDDLCLMEFTGGIRSVLIKQAAGAPRILLVGEIDSSQQVSVPYGDLFSRPGSEWVFLGIVHDQTGGETRFYAAPDGEALSLIGTADDLALGWVPGLPIGDVLVGAHTFTFRGSIFEPQVWEGALSFSELQDLMDAPPAGTETNLVFYCPLDGLDAAALTDSVSGVVADVGDERAVTVPHLTIDLYKTPCSVTRRGLRPARNIEVRYKPNFAPLSPEAVAATVPQDESQAVQTEYLSVDWSSPEVGDDYLTARDVVIPGGQHPGLWREETGAQAVLRFARYRFSPDRELLQLSGLDYRPAMLLRPGHEVRVIGPTHGLSAGKTFRVVSMTARKDQTVTLALWR